MNEESAIYQRLAVARSAYQTAQEKQRVALDILNAEKAAYDNVLWEVEVHKATEASGLRRTGRPVVDITAELIGRKDGMAIVAVGFDWGRIARDNRKYTCRVDVLVMDMPQLELRFQDPTLEGVLSQVADVLNRGISDLTLLLNDVTDVVEKLTCS